MFDKIIEKIKENKELSILILIIILALLIGGITIFLSYHNYSSSDKKLTELRKSLTGNEEIPYNIEKKIKKTVKDRDVNILHNNKDIFVDLFNVLYDYISFLNDRDYEKAYEMLETDYMVINGVEEYTYDIYLQQIVEENPLLSIELIGYLEREDYYICSVNIFVQQIGEEQPTEGMDNFKEGMFEYTVIKGNGEFKIVPYNIELVN